MTRTLLALLTLPALAACQTMPGDGGDEGETYIARGNEPGWILRMSDKAIDYEGDYGGTKITDAKPVSKPSFNGLRYITPKITVDVTYAPCTDDAERRYADSVSVTTSKGTVKGCGGKLLPPADLGKTKWRLLSINDVKVDDLTKTEVAFDGKRMSATTGCNRMGGDYSVKANIITFGPIISTKMACPGGQSMQLESAFSALLSVPVTSRFTPGGDWLIYDGQGRRALLTQVE